MGAISSRNVRRFADVFRELLAPGYSTYGFVWILIQGRKEHVIMISKEQKADLRMARVCE